MRDDFTTETKEILAERVAFHCSNPKCRKQTSGPQENPKKSINIGVAAHITAASPGGQRFDSSLTKQERQSPENGIWLCQSCAKLVDNDSNKYKVTLLYQWKILSELTAKQELENRIPISDTSSIKNIAKLESTMPELINEMRQDLMNHPLSREFVILKKTWSYNSQDFYLVYYYDDHSELDNKLRILLNYGVIQDITYNNTLRYCFTEEFVEYLTS
jgi:hypothetical protein